MNSSHWKELKEMPASGLFGMQGLRFVLKHALGSPDIVLNDER